MASRQSYDSSEEDTSSDGSDYQEVENQPLNQAATQHDSSDGEESEEETEGDGVPDGHNLPDSQSESDKSPPKRKAALHAEPVEPKRMRTAESLQPRMQPEVIEHALTKSDGEKLFQDKINSYGHLGQEVLALEEKHPGLFKSPFLKLPDEKARTLNAKLQKQIIAKLKASMRLSGIRKEVTNSLINLVD